MKIDVIQFIRKHKKIIPGKFESLKSRNVRESHALDILSVPKTYHTLASYIQKMYEKRKKFSCISIFFLVTIDYPLHDEESQQQQKKKQRRM